MAKKSTHDLQEKYFEMQMLKQQISAMVEQKQQMDERLFELRTTIDALEKLEKINRGEEIWSQIGSGTFVKSDIKDNEHVLIAVGAGVVVSEKRHKAIEVLQTRAHEVETFISELVKQANDYVERANQLEPALEKLAKEHDNKE